jgi:hypothetical protein
MSKKKFVALIAIPFMSFSNSFPSLCQSAYYQGVRDSLLFVQYHNNLSIPSGRFWVVVDVTDKTKADIITLGIILKKQGFNPLVVKVKNKFYLVVYTSNSYNDAKGVANQLPVAKAEAIEAPKQWDKLYFNSLCVEEVYTGTYGMKVLLDEFERLANQNLDDVKMAKVQRLIKALRLIIFKKAQTEEEKREVRKILQSLLGGDK